MADDVFERDTTEFDRGLSFFDAIYGVAITLLVINIDPPAAKDWASWEGLTASGVFGQIFAFLISFAVIARFWRVNHRLMGRINQLNGSIISANIVAAGLIVMIPFSTSAMSEPGVGDLALPTAVYAINIALASFAQSAIVLVAARSDAVNASTPAQSWVSGLITPVVFLASIPVAFLVGGTAARLSWLSILVLGPLLERILRGRTSHR